MTSEMLNTVMQSFPNRAAVRFLIRQGRAELSTIDPATGGHRRWPVVLQPTADGGFTVAVDDPSLADFARCGVAFALTSEAAEHFDIDGAVDEFGVPTEHAVQRVHAWVDLAPAATSRVNATPSLRLALRNARVDWRPGLGG